MIFNWLQIAITAGLTLLVAYGLHSLDIDRIEAKQAKTIQSQIAFDIMQCQKQKEITKGANDDLQNKYDALAAQYQRLQQRPAKTVYIARSTVSSDGKTSSSKLPDGNGVSDQSLYNFANRCEKTRLQLINLQEFNIKTWKSL